MTGIGLTRPTAGKLKTLLMRRAPFAGDDSIPRGGASTRSTFLVRCTSITPADGSGIGAECYPGEIIDPAADVLADDFRTFDPVWLTVLAVGGTVTAPELDSIYPAELLGQAEAVAGDSRPRAVAGLPGGSTVTGGGVIVRATAAGANVNCYRQADDGAGGLEDTGAVVAVKKFTAPAREDFEVDGYYIAVHVGEQWYAETGPLTECVNVVGDGTTAYLDCETDPPSVVFADLVPIRVINRSCA